MSEVPERSRWPTRALRGIPIVLGTAAGFSLLFVGTTVAPGRGLWTSLVVVGLLLVALVVGKRFFPKIATGLHAGIAFLVSAALAALLAVAGVAVLMWSSFDTEYAPGYSAKAFNVIRVGDTFESVLSKLGEPWSSRQTEPFRSWIYSASEQPSFAEDGIGQGTHTTFGFDGEGRVKYASGQTSPSPHTIRFGDGENHLRLKSEEIELVKGASEEEIRNRFGPPVATYEYQASTVLIYSRSPSSSNYHLRNLGMDENGKVVHIWKSIYWD